MLDTFAIPIFRITMWVAIAAVIYFAVCPAEAAPDISGWDKANHSLAFAFLGILAKGAYPGHSIRAHVALAGLGALIEVLQYFVPSRSADWKDFVADVLGIAIAAAVAKGLGAMIVTVRKS